jgi:stage II sporulation protein P
MKAKKNSFFLTIQHSFLTVLLSIGLVVLTTTYLSYKTSFETIGSMIDRAGLNNIFLAFFQSENHHFVKKDLSLSQISLYKVGLELAANIRTDDIRTFFGREIPGMSYYATQIEVAGEGTDITNLPIESAPPIEVMLKEREVAQDALLNDDEDKTDQHEPPSRTTDGKKVVYIYQSHSWESYLPLLKNADTPNEAVSPNTVANVVGVGEKLRKELESMGIGAEHNTINATQALLKRGWNYNNSYQLSRGIVQEAMASNKNIQFALDIHRDSLRKDKTTVKIGDKSYARLVFIVGQANPNYQQNLELAKQIHNAIQKKYPGLSRGVFTKGKSEGNGIYNQDLSKRASLIEFGGVDNNMVELSNTVHAFVDIFSTYYWESKDAGKF